MQAVVDSLLTEYQVEGQGPVVVMLHGWGDDHRSFQQLSRQLAKQYRVISLDLPGFGASQLPPAVWSLTDYAKFVASFLKKIKAEPVYAMVGHSNGAAVIIKGLANGYLQTYRVVLLAAAGIRTTGSARKKALKLVAKTGKAATFWLPSNQRRKLRRQLYKTAGSDMLLKPELTETFKRTVAEDVQNDAAHLQIPVLLLYGQDDTATPPLYGELFHNLIGHSTLEIVGEAGHFIHLDQPDRINQAVREFLSA